MKMINMAFMHLLRMLKDKKTIIIMLLMPAVIINLVAFFTSGSKDNSDYTVNVSLCNLDKGNYSNELIYNIKKNTNFSVKIKNEKDALDDVKNNTVDSAIIIPNNFSQKIDDNEKTDVKIIKLSNSNMYYLTNEVVNNEINNIVNKDNNKQKLNASFEEVKKNNTRSLSGVISTNLIISFAFYSMIYMIIEMIQLKKNRTLRRSLSTPNSNFSIIGSVFIAMFLLFAIQSLILVLSTKILFHIYWGKSVLAIIAVFAAMILVILSMGIFLTKFVKEESQASVAVNLIVTPTCIVSGVFIPLQFLPKVFQKIAYFIPQNWACTALNNIALKNCGITDVLPNILILLLFAVAFFTAGAASLKNMTE